ncbi:hypothetical protein Zmor_025392 [Zophobas morio]|uniref:DNA ligase 4 n=1 Tax=Zophobas morio TaxID=2755281 RepID=A0AA38HWU2_9CUCU|nr:hypothetical protein Zmor_025392 [Zophobas morio]
MNFAELCDFLETLRDTKGAAEKSKHTKSFFTKLRDRRHEIHPVLRLVVPRLERDRPSYRIKESKITKLLIKMLGLPPGNDKTLLLKSVTGSSVDFGDIVYSILKKYIINKEIGLTIHDINTYLDQIATRTSDTGLDDQILEIFRKLSPKNIKWLIQIILKDLKLGISDNTILNCVHEDGANFYAANNNLKKLCEVLHDPKVKLHELEINIFEPFKPMLSKRCDASNFKKCFPDAKTFVTENKFDGERFQLHMEDGKFKYFSRNGYDFTNSYGASFEDGIFTPLLKNVFDLETKRVILDGEMMLWNKKTKRFGSKGMNYDVKKLGLGKYQPCFCVFDILMHNDTILTNQSLRKRLQILKKVVKNPVEGAVVVSKYSEVSTRSDVVDALNTSVDNNEEGIVVKDTSSVYKCSDRNSGWFKMKMEYFDDVVHDLDVLMMGGTYGSGNKLNSFIVGVSAGVGTFYSLGSISSGLNDEELDLLSDKFKTHGIDFKDFSTKTKGKLFFGRETPHVYIEPENSYIFQIRATELIRVTNDAVKCPYTLRFPRVLKIRDDKPPDDCLSMNELLELSQNKTIVKLNKRHIDLDEIISKARPSKKIKVEVVSFEQPDAGDFLKNIRFYVDSGTEKWGTEEIYHSIKKLGGEVSYRLEPNVDIVLISKLNTKISNAMKQSNGFDIIHVDWLRRVLEDRELVDYKSDEIFYCGSNFRRNLSTNLDQFGDSFMAKTSKASLQRAFDMMRKKDDFLNTNDALAVNDRYYFSDYVAYFDRFEEINNPGSKQIYYSYPDELEFEFYKGAVNKELTPEVNLVVLAENNHDRKLLISNFIENNGLPKIEIVAKDFIFDKISSQA